MNKDYIEREVERKTKIFQLRPMGIGMIIISFFPFLIFFLTKATVFAIFGVGFFIIGIYYLIYSNTNKYKKDLEQGKQYVRDKITRQEELREAQLNALKKGHKTVSLTGKMGKLK